MTDRQDLITLVVGFVAAVPGLVAFLLLWQRETTGQAAKAAAKAAALENQVAVQTQIQAQMQQQITAQQQTIRFLTRRVDELEASREREYAETETLRQENETLRQEIAELRRGVAELFRQIEAAKLTPAWQPSPQSSSGKRPKGIDVAGLRKRIVSAFSLREIGDLAFELGVDPDEVPGETATDRARSLVTYLQDRGRLDELVTLCREKRENGGF